MKKIIEIKRISDIHGFYIIFLGCFAICFAILPYPILNFFKNNYDNKKGFCIGIYRLMIGFLKIKF